MLELFLKLIDKCIELAKRKQELSEKEFALFVQPIFELFDSVHSEYIESFTKYRERIVNGEEPLSSIAASVEADNVLTAGRRIKLDKLGQHSHSTASAAFVARICEYLIDPDYSIRENADGLHSMISGQVFRNGLATELRIIEEEQWYYIYDPQGTGLMEPIEELVLIDAAKVGGIEKLKRELAVNRFNEIVNRMQIAYSEVLDAYAKIRKQLLSPI